MHGAEQYRTESLVHQGYELVYDTYGQGERLIVYLHGRLLDADLNRGVAERGNRVVLLDLLGHGRSDKPTHASAYRIDSYEARVFALMDELHARNAVLGGLSLGANVSLFDRVGEAPPPSGSARRRSRQRVPGSG